MRGKSHTALGVGEEGSRHQNSGSRGRVQEEGVGGRLDRLHTPSGPVEGAVGGSHRLAVHGNSLTCMRRLKSEQQKNRFLLRLVFMYTCMYVKTVTEPVEN